MATLIVIPTADEYIHFSEACKAFGHELMDKQIGRMACKSSNQNRVTVACGGLGKVQFGISTQHLIDSGSAWDLVICAGAGGGLGEHLQVGDIVVGTETVEYDIKNHFGPPLLPRLHGSDQSVQNYRMSAKDNEYPFNIYFGTIASGDQDVVDPQVRTEIIEQTGAIAVAWEGAGGAKACQFSDVPFLEVRVISDGADDTAASDYGNNLETAMANLATFLLRVSLCPEGDSL